VEAAGGRDGLATLAIEVVVALPPSGISGTSVSFGLSGFGFGFAGGSGLVGSVSKGLVGKWRVVLGTPGGLGIGAGAIGRGIGSGTLGLGNMNARGIGEIGTSAARTDDALSVRSRSDENNIVNLREDGNCGT
jgi:hypothetical protein